MTQKSSSIECLPHFVQARLASSEKWLMVFKDDSNMDFNIYSSVVIHKWIHPHQVLLYYQEEEEKQQHTL